MTKSNNITLEFDTGKENYTKIQLEDNRVHGSSTRH